MVVTQIRICMAALIGAASPPTRAARRARRRGETGLEVVQVVILAAAFAALALLAAAVIKVKVLDTANNIQTQ